MSDHWKALTRLLGAPDAAEPPTHSSPLTPEPRQAQDPSPESESPPATDPPPTGAAPSKDVSSDLIQELVTPPAKTTLPGFQSGAKLNASWDELVDELGIEPTDTTPDTAAATAPPVAAGETSKEKELEKFPSRTKERTGKRESTRKPSGFGAGLVEPQADDHSTADITGPADQSDRHRTPESSRSAPESAAKRLGTADATQSPDALSSDKDSTSPIDDDLFSGFAGANRRSGRRRERPAEPAVDAPAQEHAAADADRGRHRDTAAAEVQSRGTTDRREPTQDSGMVGDAEARSERHSRRRPRRGERQLLDQAPASAEDTASREAATDIDRGCDTDSGNDGDVVPRRRRRRRRGRGPSEARGSELIEATDEVFSEQADQPTVTGKGRRDRDQETPKGSRRAERPDPLFDDDHEDADEVAELRRNRPRRRQNDEAGPASRVEGRTTPRRSSSDPRDESGSRSRDTSLDDYVPLKKGSAVVTWSDTIDILVSANLANRKGDSRTRGRGRGNGDSGRRQDR